MPFRQHEKISQIARPFPGKTRGAGGRVGELHRAHRKRKKFSVIADDLPNRRRARN